MKYETQTYINTDSTSGTSVNIDFINNIDHIVHVFVRATTNTGNIAAGEYIPSVSISGNTLTFDLTDCDYYYTFILATVASY